MYACIYEHRKNCCGTGGRVDGNSKVLQEVLADLKMYLVNHHHYMYSINPALGLDFCGVYETRGTFFNPFKVPVMPCMRFGRFINS